MLQMLLIAAGGALGAMGRYWVSSHLVKTPNYLLPWGTLTVNVVGSLLMGIFFVVVLERGLLPPETRALVMVGFLGAFTTFSSFSMETLGLIQQGHMLAALIYISLNVICCIAAAAGGVWLTRCVF